MHYEPANGALALTPGQDNRKGIQQLLTASDWLQLPRCVQRRFNSLFTPGHTVCYTGRAVENRMSRTGWCLAQLGRLFGSPLPLVSEPGPVAVTVTDHEGNGGGHWCRIYHRPAGAAQCIQSVKRFCGPTGMEESLGSFLFGLRLAIPLRVRVHKVSDGHSSLQFLSEGLALYVGSLRWSLPRWLMPVDLLVAHRPLEEARFEFELSVSSTLLGELIYQRMEFTESVPVLPESTTTVSGLDGVRRLKVRPRLHVVTGPIETGD